VPETVVPKISQETLAEMVGTTRSRVSFFMNRFGELGLHSLCRRDRRRPTGSQFTAECSSERLSSPHCSSLSPIKNRLRAPCDLAGRTQRCGGRDPVVLVGNGEIGMASQSNSAAASIGNWKPEIAYPGQAAAGTALRWPTAH